MPLPDIPPGLEQQADSDLLAVAALIDRDITLR